MVVVEFVFADMVDHVVPVSLDRSISYPVTEELVGAFHIRSICDVETGVGVILVGGFGTVVVVLLVLLGVTKFVLYENPFMSVPHEVELKQRLEPQLQEKPIV